MRNQEFHKGIDGLKSLGTPVVNKENAVLWCDVVVFVVYYKIISNYRAMCLCLKTRLPRKALRTNGTICFARNKETPSSDAK